MMHQNDKICRTCLCIDDTLFNINTLIPDSDLIPIKDKLACCIPELDLSIIADAVICQICLKALHAAFSFRTRCLETEKCIQDHIQGRKDNNLSPMIDLGQIINNSYKLNNQDQDVDMQETKFLVEIKTEKIYVNIDDGKIKQEPVDEDDFKSEETCQTVNEVKYRDEDCINKDINNSYKCLKCSKTYTRKTDLLAHVHTHIRKKSEKTKKMKKTLLKQPDNDKDNSLCKLCQKRFHSKSNLTVHMRIHTGEKPYSCKTCPKAFTQKVYLIAHERTHTGEKPFNCTLCNKSFAQKSYLRTHMIVHTGVKHHICKICGKGCAHTGDLNTHMRVHTGEKPYKCQQCSKCFTQSVHLKSHIKIHTGEKPHACEICNSRFMEKRYLRKHMQVHMRENRAVVTNVERCLPDTVLLSMQTF